MATVSSFSSACHVWVTNQNITARPQNGNPDVLCLFSEITKREPYTNIRGTWVLFCKCFRCLYLSSGKKKTHSAADPSKDWSVSKESWCRLTTLSGVFQRNFTFSVIQAKVLKQRNNNLIKVLINNLNFTCSLKRTEIKRGYFMLSTSSKTLVASQ